LGNKKTNKAVIITMVCVFLFQSSFEFSPFVPNRIQPNRNRASRSPKDQTENANSRLRKTQTPSSFYIGVTMGMGICDKVFSAKNGNSSEERKDGWSSRQPPHPNQQNHVATFATLFEEELLFTHNDGLILRPICWEFLVDFTLMTTIENY